MRAASIPKKSVKNLKKSWMQQTHKRSQNGKGVQTMISTHRSSLRLSLLAFFAIFLAFCATPAQADGWYKASNQGCLSVCVDAGLYPLFVGQNSRVNRSYACRGYFSTMNRGGMNHETESRCWVPGGGDSHLIVNFYCYCVAQSLAEQQANFEQ